MHNIINKVQCGYRKQRGAIDHLVRLDTEIRTAYAKDDHFVSVFYDRTWKYGIVRDLHSVWLRGRLPLFIKHFLEERTIAVRIRDYTTEEKKLENGLPQRSVLSVMLFAMKINDVKVIPQDFKFHVSFT